MCQITHCDTVQTSRMWSDARQYVTCTSSTNCDTTQHGLEQDNTIHQNTTQYDTTLNNNT